MDYMLIIIAAAIFLLTIVMNGVVMIHFSDEQDKNQAWLPKLVVVSAGSFSFPRTCETAMAACTRRQWPSFSELLP